MDFYEYSYMIEDVLETGILSVLFSGIPSGLFGIATYVLTSLGLYTVARRRGLNHAWLTWIPVLNCWIIGSLSDQYRYVVKGEIKSKRKVLLVLNIILLAIGAAMIGVIVAAVLNLVGDAMNVAVNGPANSWFSERQAMEMVMGPLVGIAGLTLPMAGISIAIMVIRYMALYDIYRSMDPVNCVLYTVLSILFSVTEPFFLFFNRNKDLGMPPRRQEPIYQPPVYIPEEPVPEPWDDKDYL